MVVFCSCSSQPFRDEELFLFFLTTSGHKLKDIMKCDMQLINLCSFEIQSKIIISKFLLALSQILNS
jgi:hypothetical protein